MERATTSSSSESDENVVGRSELPMVIHMQQETKGNLPILVRLRQECERSNHDESELWGEERYKLEAQVTEATDEGLFKAKLLDEASEELRLAKLDAVDVLLPPQTADDLDKNDEDADNAMSDSVAFLCFPALMNEPRSAGANQTASTSAPKSTKSLEAASSAFTEPSEKDLEHIF
ncbi:hypothetical protein H4Q26_006301 [Puccinia striiformis f. sp. tritici PST-130]|nr:hypothetical protein H4Q26_006301 [Puccinia striiformis f. sp. tritici PST-130]